MFRQYVMHGSLKQCFESEDGCSKSFLQINCPKVRKTKVYKENDGLHDVVMQKKVWKMSDNRDI